MSIIYSDFLLSVGPLGFIFSNTPIYTLPEHEHWFQPPARSLFLIMHVYVQVCDKKLNWQRDCWFAVLFFFLPASHCQFIKVTYLSVSWSVSRWMTNMYIQTGIQCQLCIDGDVNKKVAFKLKWWHSISNRLVRWHILLPLSEVQDKAKTTTMNKGTIPKVKSILCCHSVFLFCWHTYMSIIRPIYRLVRAERYSGLLLSSWKVLIHSLPSQFSKALKTFQWRVNK